MVDDDHHPDFVTLVQGGADDGERTHVERHLLVCETCWEAVRDDRHGRLLAENLRENAPAALRDRIALSIEAAETPPRRHWPPPRRHRRRVAAMAAMAAVAVVILLVAGVVALRPFGGRSPGVGERQVIISTIATLATQSRAGPLPSSLSEDGQRATISTTTASGTRVIVARSATPFPMPAGAVPMTSATSPWIARRGGVTLVCFNLPHPILVASVTPLDRLVPLARQLGHIGP